MVVFLTKLLKKLRNANITKPNIRTKTMFFPFV